MELKSQLLSKLPDVGTTIFTVMSKLAQQHGAVNMAQGFPDFNCPEELTELIIQYLKKGYNQYAPMPGILPLREKISQKILALYRAYYNPESEITLTCGATEACFVAITTMIKPGDEVIIFEPAFDCYVPVIKLCGGKPVFVQLKYPDYKIDWEQVKKLITKKTKLIIINSPHNPTGSIIDKKDIQELEKIVESNDLFILSDEVYEHIVFDGEKHESISSSLLLKEKSFVVSSLGKTYHATGWRMGYCVAPSYLTEEFRKVHQFNTFSAVTFLQYAIADYMENKEHYLNLPIFFQKKRDYFLTLLKNSAFTWHASKGTYFQLLSYKEINSGKDTDFAIRLTEEMKIASIPISVFYHNQYDAQVLRFCFAKEESTLQKAAEILCRI